ncbi:hypothetical protein Gohar_015373 [Gossypium harknessii]|nr:hypothetical protein [Gossypium harknessii]
MAIYSQQSFPSPFPQPP